ncbi:MAG: flagellar protein FlgN [Nitrospinae bacterium]|nr:flagellar protein FlgN [Nitrospinota bacterium]
MELKELTDSLDNLVRRNIKLYTEMESALHDELEALKAHSLDKLDTAIQKKMEVVSRLKMIEDSRIKMVQAIAKRLGLSPEQITLSKLAEVAGAGLKEKIVELKTRLKEKVDSVTEKNEFNRGFIEKLMKLNYAAAANLQELLAPESTYHKGSTVRVALKPGKVVSRTL